MCACPETCQHWAGSCMFAQQNWLPLVDMMTRSWQKSWLRPGGHLSPLPEKQHGSWVFFFLVATPGTAGEKKKSHWLHLSSLWLVDLCIGTDLLDRFCVCKDYVSYTGIMEISMLCTLEMNGSQSWFLGGVATASSPRVGRAPAPTIPKFCNPPFITSTSTSQFSSVRGQETPWINKLLNIW